MAEDLEPGAPSLEGEYHAPGDWLPIHLETRATAPKADAEELLALARQRATDPTVFEEYPPVFFSGIVSTNSLDSYYTKMHRSSLENFAADLTEGRVLLDSHNSFNLANHLGYSLRGRYIAGGGDGKQRTQADFYVVPVDPASTTFLRKMQAGTVRDLSAGFHGGQWLCDLDGQVMGRWNDDPEKRCLHWPGYEYEGRMATATIHNARLAETSAVYDGATPGSMILRARQMSEAGLIVPEMARYLEVQYRIKLPASHRAWAGATTHGKEPAMANEPGANPPQTETPGDVGVLQAFHRSIGDALKDLGPALIAEGMEPATAVRKLGEELTELRPLRDKVADLETRIRDLEPRAKDGDSYREATIAETWGEYNRAGLAEGVDEAEQKALWQRAPLDQVKKERESYRKLGDARCGGGRVSVDQGDPPSPAAAQPAVPLHLYAA